MSLVLIDTSVWVDLLRGTAQQATLGKMQTLLENGDAAWCEMIRLELWTGVKDAKERKQLSSFDTALHSLPINEDVWKQACINGGLARSKGITAPPSDHIIFACSRVHNIELWHSDKHFDLLAKF